MEKSLSHSLPMHTEIINIESSDSDGDIEFYLDDFLGADFVDDMTAQSGNNSERFMEQNHPGAHIPQHHCNGFAPHASTSTSGEHINNIVRENVGGSTVRDKYLMRTHTSEGAIHTSQSNDCGRLLPRETCRVSTINGGYDTGHESNEEAIQDSEGKNINHVMSQASLESGYGTDGHSIDARVLPNSKRILPHSLKPYTSGTISSFHENTLLSPHKNSVQAEKNRGSQTGPKNNNGRLDANSNHFVQKSTHLIHPQPKNASNGHFNEQDSDQITELLKTVCGSGKSKPPGSKFYVEEIREMPNENQFYEGERRTLPSHWNGKTTKSSQMKNAYMHNKGIGQQSTFVTNSSNPLANNLDSGHNFSDLLIGNDKLISSSKGLYKGRDDFLLENASMTRTLPQYPGKFCGNPRLAGSDGGHLPGSGENRHEHDETPIYQEALQNLVQPNLEDDLPEGILTVSLLKHQKIALAWMVQKEKSVHCAGGILADDQGLGKTISMIALILKQKSLQSKFMSDSSPLVNHEALNLDDDEAHIESNVKDIGKNDLQRKPMTSTSDNRRPAAGTLVVCPASVLRQWAHEIEEKVSSCAELTVVIHHGGTRSKDPRDLAKYDVVLTTYSIVSNEVTKQPLGDDDDESEPKDMKKYGLSSEFTAGKKRKQKLNAERKGKKKGKARRASDNDCCSGALGRVRWFRVILDEAQTIKNHRTQVAGACSGLRAKRRWCLSGTPMQNSIDDLYSYFRFLKYEPYAVYSSFCNAIKYPISRNASQGYKKLQTVLRIVLLRRTKATKINGEPIIKLPSKSINLERVKFSSEERVFYLNLEADSRQHFKAYAAAGTVKQNYANILLMLLRLRQACNHPILVKGFHSEAIARDSLEMAKKLPKELLLNLLYKLEESLSICPVCSDTPEDPVVTICGHVFCHQCVSDRLTGDDNCCLVAGCKEILGTDIVYSQATLKACTYDEPTDEATTSSKAQGEESTVAHFGYVSSKIKAAVDILRSLPSTHQIEESEDDSNSNKPVKAIVFSQWTGMLDLMELSLNHALIEYRRFDGTMSLNARDKAVREFNTDPEVAVMLMSLKAGNLGLNMASACHVILLDLWWNPTTEDQAIDRAHRIGQTRPVLVSRLTVKDTIEDRILALQEEKRKMVSSAFGVDKGSSHTARLTVEDLKYLFMA